MPHQRTEILGTLATGRSGADVARLFCVHRAPSGASRLRREPYWPLHLTPSHNRTDTSSQDCIAKRKKLNLQRYPDVTWRPEGQLIEITHFPDRHFWHRGYDKANTLFARREPLSPGDYELSWLAYTGTGEKIGGIVLFSVRTSGRQ